MSLRQYEILFIAEQNLGEPEVDTLTATVKGFIEKENGTVEKVEKWGKKRLAYPIGKNREGSYVLMVANSPGRSMLAKWSAACASPTESCASSRSGSTRR